MGLPTPTAAKVRVASASRSHPERLPDLRRDLYLANLARKARETVDAAIACGASRPTPEQMAELAAILNRW